MKNNAFKKLKNRNSSHNQSNKNGIYNQYIQDYKYYFNNALNKCKYSNKYNRELSGECIILDVSTFNQKNGDEKYITTFPNSKLQIGDVIELEFAKDTTECWIIEEKENLPIPSHDKFKISPLYFPAIVIRNNKESYNIDTKVVNKNDDLDKKLIYYSPLINKISIGDYVKYDENTICLINDLQKFNNYPYGEGLLCNQKLKWKDKNGVHEYACYCKNDSYGVKDSYSGSKLEVSETKLKIYVQFNNETENIKENMRFMFNNREQDIYKVITASTVINENLLILTCENDSYRPQDDDLENNLAYNELEKKQEEKPTEPTEPKPIQSYEIIGMDSVKHKNNYTYTLNPVNSNCVWELDEIDIDCTANIVNQTHDSVTVYAIETMSTDWFTLYAKDGDTILAKKKVIVKNK